jgi:hypothetical protein
VVALVNQPIVELGSEGKVSTGVTDKDLGHRVPLVPFWSRRIWTGVDPARIAGGKRFPCGALENIMGRGTGPPSTLEICERSLKVHVLSTLGVVRLREMASALLDRFLKTVLSSAGGLTARLRRSVVSGTLVLALSYRAPATNSVRDADRLSARPAKESWALTL